MMECLPLALTTFGHPIREPPRLHPVCTTPFCFQLGSAVFAGGYDGFGVAARPARGGTESTAGSTRRQAQLSQQLITEPNRSCETGPVNRYVLIKTHKTGGSTLANILHRRTWRHKLRPVTSA